MPSFTPEPPQETDFEVYVNFLKKADVDNAGLPRHAELYTELMEQWRTKELSEHEARERAFEISTLDK